MLAAPAVRPYEERDRPAIAALLAALGWSAAQVEGQLGALEAPDAVVLVAEAQGDVRGFVTVGLRAWNRLAQLDGLAVSPAHRRAGLATLLLEAAERSARAAGMRGVRVDTPVDNTPARALYAARGYTQGDRMPRYYDDDTDGIAYSQFFD